jgi:hypothetical protein
VNKAKDQGLLHLPIDVGYSIDFAIIQYADDTFIILEVCPLQLFALKAILNTFTDSTGLRANYSKSCIYPINVPQERLNHLAATFHYSACSLPFTYLGLHLSMNKPTVQDCLPMVNKVERRLVSTSLLLSQGAKLQLVNSIMSSLATFYLYSRKVPISILNQIEKYRRHYLW